MLIAFYQHLARRKGAIFFIAFYRYRISPVMPQLYDQLGHLFPRLNKVAPLKDG
jgi:hypothetical protein